MPPHKSGGKSHKLNFKQKKVLCVESPDSLTDGTQHLLGSAQGLLPCKYRNNKPFSDFKELCNEV